MAEDVSYLDELFTLIYNDPDYSYHLSNTIHQLMMKDLYTDYLHKHFYKKAKILPDLSDNVGIYLENYE